MGLRPVARNGPTIAARWDRRDAMAPILVDYGRYPVSINIFQVRLYRACSDRRTSKGAIKHEPLTSLRVGCGKQSCQRTPLRYAELRCTLNSNCVHHRADIIHALLQRRNFGDWIGKASPALVEYDDASEAPKAKQPAS